MARTPQNVTDKELSILEVLWREGSATIRQIVEELYPDGGHSKHATVQKLLERLEEEGFVIRERSAGPHRYQAAVDRDQLIGQQLRSVAERLCGGSVTPLLTHLVRTQRLSSRERAELRALIDGLDEKKGKGKDAK